VAAQILENTSADLGALLERGEVAATPEQKGEAAEAVLTYVEVRGSPGELKAIGARLKKLIKSISGSRPKADASGQAYRLTIAYFPLVKGRSGR
jgi:hypothetical protein